MSTYTSAIEGVLRDLQDWIKDNFDMYTKGIYALRKDSHRLGNLKDVFLGEYDAYTVEPVPCLILFPGEIQVIPHTMGHDRVTVECHHALVIAGAVDEDLTIRGMRSADALREMYTADMTCGGAFEGIDIAGEGEPWMRVENFASVPSTINRKVVLCTVTFTKEIDRTD
jgi:hypothetical protein